MKVTPLKEWIDRGDNDHYVIKRLKESDGYLTPANLKKMKDAGKKYLGKNKISILDGQMTESIARSWYGKYLRRYQELSWANYKN